jgi:dienelactone hydrolase
VSVGRERRTLPATLVMPDAAAPVPLIVFVPGSGPRDRDGSNEGPRPFRDLAEGLASRGIASLRYEKRTYGHIAALGIRDEDFTVKEEYIDDFDAALAVAHDTAGIDPRRMVLVGHSLGGHLLPVLLARAADVAAGVVLAGHARSVLELVADQTIHASTVEPDPDGHAGSVRLLERMEKMIRRAEDPALDPNTPIAELWAGVPARYWLALRAIDPIAAARTISRPLMFLQGARDAHVTVADDLERWRTALGGDPRCVFKIYPELDHYFTVGVDTIRGAVGEGHVAEEVVRDVAEFIHHRL